MCLALGVRSLLQSINGSVRQVLLSYIVRILQMRRLMPRITQGLSARTVGLAFRPGILASRPPLA